MIIDLTAMFGPTVADAILALENGQSGAGVAVFTGLFREQYYDYSAKVLTSVRTSGKRNVGFNLYDHAAGTAKLVGGKQYQITGTYTALSYSTGQTITPDASGTFTPTYNGILTVTGGSSTDTCVHLVWDGERDGEWEAYSEHTYAFDDSLELRGMPVLDGNGSLVYDGDEYAPDGTITRKYEKRAYQAGDESLADAITDGTNTVVKLEETDTETADPYQAIEVVDNWGTEEFLPETGVSAPMIPVGSSTLYQQDLKAKLEAAPNNPSEDGLYLVKRENGVNDYVSYLGELPPDPSEDGVYVLKLTVLDGTATKTWEAQS